MMFMIYKKSTRSDPNSHRGISILNALAKLYDMVLNGRFIKWFQAIDEKAGARKGRGCEDPCPHFVDFKKAYDKLNRSKLLGKLANVGCGSMFRHAIIQLLRTSQIGECVFSASMDVRHSGATSCSHTSVHILC